MQDEELMMTSKGEIENQKFCITTTSRGFAEFCATGDNFEENTIYSRRSNALNS